jgi:hypothetical protein
MWPTECPRCYVADPLEVPPETRPYYQAGRDGGWILRDILDHLMSVNTPVPLRPVYEIRQYSHRRASFLKRHLVPADSQPQLPLYPEGLEDYLGQDDADPLHADLLYRPKGTLYPEFWHFWLRK